MSEQINTSLEPEHNKETVTRKLISIINADTKDVEGKNQLKSWMGRHDVCEAFRQAIDLFGQQEGYLGVLDLGADTDEDNCFKARFINPPACNGAPAIHLYARDGGIPTFGIMLPFTDRGILDVSRSISGFTFASEGLQSFSPQQETADAKEAACVITYATRMAAAQLAFYLEKDEPVAHTRAEEAVSLAPVESLGETKSARIDRRLISALGRLARFGRTELAA